MYPISSPSFIHEGVIALVRDEPAFAASLLRDLFEIEVPRFDHWRSFNRGKAEGEVAGEIKALLMILKQRRLAITDDQQRRIVACTDLATLDRWLDRALLATSVDELLS
jgi:hypothetical protein